MARKVIWSISILVFLLPKTLIGQSNDCNVVYYLADMVSCTLEVFSNNNDTFFLIQPDSCNTTNFNPSLNGYCVVYAEDSSTLIEQDHVIDGKRNGLCVKYFANGLIKESATYVNGEIGEKYTLFLPSGKVSRKGRKRWGKHFETTYQYWDNGKLAKRTTWKSVKEKDSKYRGKSYKPGSDRYWNKEGKRCSHSTFARLWFECR